MFSCEIHSKKLCFPSEVKVLRDEKKATKSVVPAGSAPAIATGSWLQYP
jgi:hypothetical protein